MLNRIVNFLIDPLLRSSWRSVVLLWKPMAGWTILVYALFTALITPVFVSLLNRGVFRGDRLIVGNDELLAFFLSPAGFSYLFLVILIVLTGLVIRYAGIFQIITDDLLGRRVSVSETALHIAPRIHILIKLCAITIFGALLLLLPLLAGLGIVYQVFLAEFDINYYLFSTPPEWYRALTWGGIVAGSWLIFATITAACALPALPAYLDGRKTIRQALKEVWDAPMKKTLRLIKAVLTAALIWVLFRLSAEALLLSTFLFITDWIHAGFDSLRLIAFAAGNYLFLSVAIGTVISFFGFSVISVIITKFYYGYARPEVEIKIPGLKRLTKKTVGLLTWWTKPARAILLILLLMTGGIITSYLIFDTDEGEAQVLNIAHRANALGAPENSIAALKNSIEIGADMAEIDLQMTADGRIVILHDADLMRVAGDPRRIADVTYDEIRDVRLLTNLDIPDEDLIIPTFEDFLEIADGQIILLTELKYYGFYPELAVEAVRLIREYGMEDQSPLMSLSTRSVNQVREIAPDIYVGYVSALAAGDLAAMPVNFFAINHQNLNSGFIRETSQNGQHVYAWTVNRAEGMINAMQRGATGLITDEPQLAGEMIEQFSQLTRAERLLLQFGLFAVEGGE